MFNTRSLKIIKLYVQMCTLLGSNPYEWDEENQCISVCTKFSRKVTYYGIAIGHSVMYLCFLWWRMVAIVHHPNPSFPDVVWVYVWINQTNWSLTTFYNGHKTKEEVVSLFRGLKKLTSVLEKEYPTAKMKNWLWKFNIVDLNFLASMWIVILYNAAVTLMFFVVPTRVQYIYSLVSQDKNRKTWQFLGFLGFEAYSKSAQTGMMATDGITVFPGLLISAFWLEFTRKNCKISAAEKIKNFKRLHILNIYYNYTFVWLLVPMVFVWIPGALIISCSFASIRFHSFLTFFEYIPFPVLVYNCCVILAVTMVPATAVYEQSNKLHQAMQHDGNVSRKRNKIHRKELISLRPFGVKIGLVRSVKKVAILVSYYFISNHIFTLLITFPEDQIIP